MICGDLVEDECEMKREIETEERITIEIHTDYLLTSSKSRSLGLTLDLLFRSCLGSARPSDSLDLAL